MLQFLLSVFISVEERMVIWVHGFQSLIFDKVAWKILKNPHACKICVPKVPFRVFDKLKNEILEYLNT